ncbi:phosphotransferase [Vibrio owensii]|uniref:phosphotransferase n=1 Tax=Vibrio owensii TaxID=696485 RepID=UPI001047AEF6|nr:phosphotransferase [Vibrio owensii]TDE21618.1 phosphotransferase [Vibrio owensii]
MSISAKIQDNSHSGATLQVLKDANEYYVKKTMHTAIDKNHKAILKQHRFKSLKTPTYEVIAIPVVDVTLETQSLTVLMPYIEGVGGEQVAYKGSKTVAKNLRTALDFYLINSFSSSEDSIYPIKEVHAKIEEIATKLNERWYLFPNLKEQIRIFKDYCKDDLNLPIGECHGDLTLSNLKITEENQLALFDFLSCEINSPIQDAAKIIQDFEYGWSFRKEKESIRIKGELFCEYSAPLFINTLNRLFYYEMRVVEILTILRIAPYIREDDVITTMWFNNTMTKTINKIIG